MASEILGRNSRLPKKLHTDLLAAIERVIKELSGSRFDERGFSPLYRYPRTGDYTSARMWSILTSSRLPFQQTLEKHESSLQLDGLN
jgi:hypothetical protein